MKAMLNVRIPSKAKRMLELQAEREHLSLAQYVEKHFQLLSEAGVIKVEDDPVKIQARQHAAWFVSIIGPMIESTAETFFIHGHKHGVEAGIKMEQARMLDKIKEIPKQMQKPEEKKHE